MSTKYPTACPHCQASPMACAECGCEVTPPKKQRSYPQLQRLHVLCEAAFAHWPSTGEFRPKNKEHLRYFLECEAGHFTVQRTMRLEKADPEAIAPLLAAFMADTKDDQLFIELDGFLVTTKRVGSISYNKLSHADACKLFDEIEAVLHRYGLDANQLLRESKQAA